MVTYPILVGEIAKRSIKKKDISDCIGTCVKSLNNKMNGRTPFTWQEVYAIKKTFFPDMSVEELFSMTGDGDII